MSKPKPEDLKVIEFTSRYNNETKTFSSTWVVVNTVTLGVLCFGIPEYAYIIYHPVEWKQYTAAEEWITSGCIGDIQEDLSNLNVGFMKELLTAR